jgi:lipopolysaccharide heptosyltransferase II
MRRRNAEILDTDRKYRRMKTLRQQLITTLCTALRLPFSLLDTLRRPWTKHARQHPRSIVLIKPCCIGDLIMTTPLLEVIKQNYPAASITYVTGTWSKAIAEHHPAVDTIIDCGSVGIPGRYKINDYLKLARQLRSQHYDLAFVLDRSPMLTLLPWLAGVARRVGPDSLGRGFPLTDRVKVSADPKQLQHQAEIYLDLARAIGLHFDHPHMHFIPTEQERQSIYPANGKQVAVFVGGGSNPGMDLTSKRWPIARYQELTTRLVRELGMQVLLIGGESDMTLNQQLLAGIDVPEGTVINLAGKTSFGQTAAQIEACILFIGNDSSPMHLAAAVGTPVIAIFGPTSPTEYGPYPLDDPQHIAIWNHPSGQPCFFLGKMQACANCTCMQSVTVDNVWDAVLKLIGHADTQEVHV